MSLLYYLLSFSDDILSNCLLSGLELKDIISLENAIVKMDGRIRIKTVARKIQTAKVSLTSINKGSLLQRAVSVVQMVFCDVVQIEDIILASEIMGNTKEISVMVPEVCTDESIVAIARGAPNLLSLCLISAPIMTDRALIAIATHCRKLKWLKLRITDNITTGGLAAVCRECCMLESLCVFSEMEFRSQANVLQDVPPFCKNLRILEAVNLSISDETITKFAVHCPYLSSVKINSRLITDVAVYALINCYPDLRAFEVNTRTVSHQCLISLATSCTKLTSLCLSHAVTPAALRAFGMNCGSALETLQLEIYHSMGDINLLLQHCWRLTDVRMRISSYDDNAAFASLVHRNRLLRTLELTGTLSPTTLCALGDNCPHLQILRAESILSGTEDSAVYLAERCTALVELQLWAPLLHERAIHALATHCTKLQVLTIVINNPNYALFTLSQGCRDLRTLHLVFCPTYRIEKEAIQALSQYCQKLRVLDVGMCNSRAMGAIQAMVDERKKRGILLKVVRAVHPTNFLSWFL